MDSSAPQLPMKLGRPVQHRSDPSKAAGIILGWMFEPPLGVLVRWQHGVSTYEALTDLRDLVIAEPIRSASPSPLPSDPSIENEAECAFCADPIELPLKRW